MNDPACNYRGEERRTVLRPCPMAEMAAKKAVHDIMLLFDVDTEKPSDVSKVKNAMAFALEMKTMATKSRTALWLFLLGSYLTLFWAGITGRLVWK